MCAMFHWPFDVKRYKRDRDKNSDRDEALVIVFMAFYKPCPKSVRPELLAKVQRALPCLLLIWRFSPVERRASCVCMYVCHIYYIDMPSRRNDEMKGKRIIQSSVQLLANDQSIEHIIN